MDTSPFFLDISFNLVYWCVVPTFNVFHHDIKDYTDYTVRHFSVTVNYKH